MKNQAATAVVEFIARENVDYWEIIPLCCQPGTALRRVQRMIEHVSQPAWRSFDVAVEVSTGGFVVRFDAPDAEAAENFATLMAHSLGWKRDHGVLMGRVD